MLSVRADLHNVAAEAQAKDIIKIKVGLHTVMRKEYVIKGIDAAPDGKPYVMVSLMLAKEMHEDDGGPGDPFKELPSMTFTNMNDMMKDLNKMFGGMGMMGNQGATMIKLDMHEYKEMNIAVGERVYVDITKAESLGV